MQKPIRREKPEFDITWTETIVMTILLMAMEWGFLVSID